MKRCSNASLPSFAEDDERTMFNKKHYGDMIRTYRIKAQMSQQELADALGIHKNSVTQWESGRARPVLNIIPSLCKVLKISIPAFFGMDDPESELLPEEFHLIRGYRKISKRDRAILKNMLSKMLELTESEMWERCRISFIPILHNCQQAAAGSGTILDDATEQYQTFVRKSAEATRADEIVTVNGSSMEPMLHHGQDVFIEYTNELSIGEIGLFVVNGDGFIKQWSGDHLHSLNADYADIQLHDDDDVRCIGRVLGMVDKRDYPSPDELVILQELLHDKAFGSI